VKCKGDVNDEEDDKEDRDNDHVDSWNEKASPMEGLAWAIAALEVASEVSVLTQQATQDEQEKERHPKFDNEAISNATDLLSSACKGHYQDTIKLLRQDSCRGLNAVDSEGRSTLHWAATQGWFQVCKMILSRPDFQMAEARDILLGGTALHWAALASHGTVCSLLHFSGRCDSSAGLLNSFGSFPKGSTARDVLATTKGAALAAFAFSAMGLMFIDDSDESFV